MSQESREREFEFLTNRGPDHLPACVQSKIDSFTFKRSQVKKNPMGENNHVFGRK